MDSTRIRRRSRQPNGVSVRRRRAIVARRAVAIGLTTSLVAAGAWIAGPAPVAAADSAPADPGTPTTVTTDPLPTVQINGVAWSQVIVGGTVYVAGQFSTARPAGAAAGVSTVTRGNLLAYDLASGDLVSSWAPTLDGPAYAIAASADGSRLYVGGDFTKVNGSTQERFVVLNRSTGARVTGFNPRPNAAVRAIASTAATIYLGGNFTTAAGNNRPRLAALSATSGAMLAWRVSAQAAEVQALVLSPDNSRLIVGGRFEKLNNVAALGSGAVSASTGATLPWAANKLVTDYGYDSGITSLSTDGTLIYGTGFAYLGHAGGYGNLEGTFAADPMTGVVKWIEDCHGDTYSVYPNPGKDHIYISGHPYYCGNIGAFPEASPRVNHYALAFSKADVMTITPGIHPNYFNWAGNRAPAQLAFYPDFVKGTFTGQSQATWSVTGSGDYVAYGGEFPSVNGKAQEGLVRFATSAHAPNAQGPRLSGTALQPVAASRAAGTAQVSWPTNVDRDNETLTYAVLRDGGSTPVFSRTAKSTFWQQPRLSFTDTGLVAGRSYSYRVVATDPFGNAVTSPAVSVTVAGSPTGSLGGYAQTVLNDSPAAYWRLGETSGSALDWTAFASSTVGSSVGRAVPGALAGDTNRAAHFTGSSSSRVYGTKLLAGTNRFSVEAWFRTTSGSGGKIIGFGSSSTGTSGTFDRHVYMSADGTLTFGVYPHSIRALTTTASYNDGAWHHVVGTLGSSGMELYVDGVLRARDAGTVSAAIASGYWRIGGDAVTGWPKAGAQNFTGDIDEVAVYGRPLTSAEVAAHYAAGTGGPVALPPVASFTATATALSVAVDASGSTDPDGTIVSHAWDFGDGGTATGTTASHVFADAGSYVVTLTVTDSQGLTDTTQRTVDVAPAAPTTLAADSFERTQASFGSADLGGAWAATAGVTSVAGGQGRITLTGAGSYAGARLPAVAGTDLSTQVTESWDKRPNGSGGWFLLRGRITSEGEYRLKIAHKSSGAVTARLVRTLGGVETAITSETTVPGLTYSAGTALTARFEVTGGSPTTLRATIWPASQPEPAAAFLAATDSTAGLQGAGHTGVAGTLSSTASNIPATVSIDSYTVTGTS